MASPALTRHASPFASPVVVGLAYGIVPSLALWALIGAALWAS